MTLRKIKQAFFICVLQIGSAFFALPAIAQSAVTTSEVGVGIGAANFKGEIAPTYQFVNLQPAVTAFYRRDISNPITLRGAFLFSHRIADDNTISDASYDRPYPNYRQANMSFTIGEFSAVVEYNFLDYYDPSQRPRFSPYFFAGVAGLLYNIRLRTDNPDLTNELSKPFDTSVAVALPIGVGVKYALSKHWNLGLEFGARKLISDNVDRLSEQDSRRLANPYDKDWYFYNGVSISYTFYRINCPPTYKNKPGLLE